MKATTRLWLGWLGWLAAAGLVTAALRWRTTAFGRLVPGATWLVVALLVLLLGCEGHWRTLARRRFAAAELLAAMGEPSLRGAALLRGAWLGGAVVLLLLAAARPKGGLGAVTVSTTGVDLLVCLDLSNSMRAQDMNSEARLDVARRLLKTFVAESPNDRIGLVGFAGSAHALCPITADHEALLTIFDDVDCQTPVRQGTSLGDALTTALRSFPEQSPTGQVVVLLTDGEDQGSEPLEAARDAAARKVVVHTVGIGTSRGATIPMRYSILTGEAEPKEYQGEPVTSRLDEGTLKAIAAATGGVYFRADTPARLAEVLAAVARLGGRATEARQIESQLDVCAWYLLPAWLLLAGEPLLVLRRRREARP